MRHQFQKLTNFCFFPVLFAIATHCIVLNFNGVTGLFWLICLIRLFKTERRDLIIWAIVFSLLVLFCAGFVRLKEYPETLNSGPVKMLAFQVDTDNIKVDGDYLQLEGHVYLDDRRQRVRAVYSLGSEEGQTRWQNVDQALLATVSGVLERPSVKTNLNGFDYRSNLRNSSINQILTIESFHDLKVRKVSWYDVITHLSIVRRRLLLSLRTEIFTCNSDLYPDSFARRTECRF